MYRILSLSVCCGFMICLTNPSTAQQRLDPSQPLAQPTNPTNIIQPNLPRQGFNGAVAGIKQPTGVGANTTGFGANASGVGNKVTGYGANTKGVSQGRDCGSYPPDPYKKCP